jgi:hypothetical protein
MENLSINAEIAKVYSFARDINGSINSEAKANEFISFMEDNKNGLDFLNRQDVKEKYKKDKVFDLYMYYDVQHVFISDSLIITFTPKEVRSLKKRDLKYRHSANALFIIVMRLQVIIFNCFSEKGLFLRGGISTDYCYIKDHFAVGEGLINAYKAESSIAIYPRIAFSPEVLKDKLLKDNITELSNLMYGGHDIVKLDSDGVHHLDYLGYNLSQVDLNVVMISDFAKRNLPQYLESVRLTHLFFEKHAKAIKDKLVELDKRKIGISSKQLQKLEKVIDKFIWLKNYHNSSLLKHEQFSKHVIN